MGGIVYREGCGEKDKEDTKASSRDNWHRDQAQGTYLYHFLVHKHKCQVVRQISEFIQQLAPPTRQLIVNNIRTSSKKATIPSPVFILSIT